MARKKSERNEQRRAVGFARLRGLLAVVLLLKIALAGGWLVGGDLALARGEGPESGDETAIHPALEPVPIASVPSPGNASEARSLLESLARRQAELEKRERELAAREDRLETYEKDLAEKIAVLESLQKEISRESKAMEEQDAAAASALAKVYAAMKPSEAAPLLDRLDDETVLRILNQMRAKQIGELLPLLDRDKAIVLTQALAGGSK